MATFKSMSNGSSGEVLTEFPVNYVQPSKQNKRRIQTAYLDLLHYEYRIAMAGATSVVGQLLVITAIVILALQSYIKVAAVLFAIIGIIVWIRSRKEGNRFVRFHRQVREALKPMGAGIEGLQLLPRGGSTAMGTAPGYALSDLGIVRPVSTKGFVEDLLYVFDIYDDQVYK